MKVNDTFTIPALTSLIRDEFNGDVYTRLKLEYDFMDSTVNITGSVYEDYKYDNGDYWTPPSTTFISRTVDLDSVCVSYNDEHIYELDSEEIYKLEKELEK